MNISVGTLHGASDGCVLLPQLVRRTRRRTHDKFELTFNYNDDITNFSISWPIRRSAIKADMNLMEIDEPEDITFRSIYSIEINADYEDFDGDVYVKSVSSKEIKLQFSNFSFYKSGRKKYTINGTMTYKIG